MSCDCVEIYVHLQLRNAAIVSVTDERQGQ